MAKLKKDELVALAKEINAADILSEDLKESGSIGELKTQLEDVAGLFRPEDKEFFSDKAWANMNKLNLVGADEDEKTSAAEEETPAEAPEEETSVEEPEEESEEEIEEKKPKKDTPKKEGVKKGGFRGTKIKDRMAFMKPLIEKGINRNELIEKTMKKFPDATKSAIQVIICDGKNPKYCKFDRLIVEDENKTLTFGDKVEQ